MRARFLTLLEVREEDARHWRTLTTLSYESAVLGARVDVPTDFITDFASVPRLPLSWWVAGDIGRRAAVVHDWLYQRHEVQGRPVSRLEADRAFLEALGALGVWLWRRSPMYAAVRLCGGPSWRSGPARFAALNPIWTAQERAEGAFTPRRDRRLMRGL